MSEKIFSLPTEVIDQIAAGEVVERPAHLVKELVENSIDAGASEIEVRFGEGGRYVQVTDNGLGISEKDLPKALERFATSKIKTSDDLWKLKSFGFRGEALASIAAVCKLTLVSRPPGAESAYRLVSQFGRVSSPEKIGGSFGTTILIQDLFENVPARLKFMKSTSAEGTYIKTTLKALALAHPEVSFKVFSEDEMIFFWSKAPSRLERAKQVLDVDHLYEGSAEREGVRAFSVFADPKTVAKTSKNMWFFAQNRWIQDRSLQAAVMEAYRNLLMHGEYPICVTWVETDPENIDVNIHPTKSQVKFVEPSLAFRAVQASVRDTLEKAPWIPAQVTTAVQNFSHNFLVKEAQQTELHEMNTYPRAAPASEAVVRDSAFQSVQYQKKEIFSPEASMRPFSSEKISETFRQPISEATLEASRGYWSSLDVLGQANLTYILSQSRDSLVLVDQHAAHERVLFEKLMRAWKSGGIEIQEFLFPLAIDLSSDKVEALLKEAASLEKLGVSLESLGPSTVGVKGAPLILKETALSSALEKMAQELVDHGGSYSLEKSIGDLCATMACHSAIRAGQALSLQEMRTLLVEMDQFPLSSFCPHGRPVSIDFSFQKIEKDFGRIN